MIPATLPPGQQAIVEFLSSQPGRIFPSDAIPPAPGSERPPHATAADLVALRLADLIGFAFDPQAGRYGYVFQSTGTLH